MSNRCPGPSYQDILDRDAVAAPEILRETAAEPLGSADLPIDAYLSPEQHRREVEGLWRRVWQVAGRVEDVAAPGDSFVYDIADDSLVVLRTQAGELRAYHNACLHRGTRRVLHGKRVRARWQGIERETPLGITGGTARTTVYHDEGVGQWRTAQTVERESGHRHACDSGLRGGRSRGRGEDRKDREHQKRRASRNATTAHHRASLAFTRSAIRISIPPLEEHREYA